VVEPIRIAFDKSREKIKHKRWIGRRGRIGISNYNKVSDTVRHGLNTNIGKANKSIDLSFNIWEPGLHYKERSMAFCVEE
jgi:hypothetical protein